MEKGTPVKIEQPWKNGEKKEGIRYRKGKIEEDYGKFILVKMQAGYLECFSREEIKEEDKKDNKLV